VAIFALIFITLDEKKGRMFHFSSPPRGEEKGEGKGQVEGIMLVHLAGRYSNRFAGRYADSHLCYAATTAGQSTINQISALVNLCYWKVTTT